MKRVFRLLIAVVTAYLCFSAAIVFAEDAPVFTDSDLQRYEGAPPVVEMQDSGPQTRPEKSRPSPGAVSSAHGAKADLPGSDDRNYWCRKAEDNARAIKNAEVKVKQIEDKIAKIQSRYLYDDMRIGDTQGKARFRQQVAAERLGPYGLDAQVAAERSKLKHAEEAVKTAKEKQSEFEQEAHRRSIPPGWLRCQFE